MNAPPHLLCMSRRALRARLSCLQCRRLLAERYARLLVERGRVEAAADELSAAARLAVAERACRKALGER